MTKLKKISMKTILKIVLLLAVSTNLTAQDTDYSEFKNFDFTPADKVIYFEDFSDKSLTRWQTYDMSQLGIHSFENQNWLEVKSGNFYPVDLKVLPNYFTLEFDVYTPTSDAGTLWIEFVDKSQADLLNDPYLDNSSSIVLSPITQMPKTGLGKYEKRVDNNFLSPDNEFQFYSWQPDLGKYKARISLTRNENELSMWINNEKVMDNIDFFVEKREHLITFHLANYFVAETRMYFTNIRLATGKPDVKSDLLTNKKFITQNIFFNVNSDIILPKSYAALKEIAKSINSIDGNILIIGHTDSDGTDSDNLILSQKRAESVKKNLVHEFGVNADKLSTDGKGESEPLNNNSSPSEKAQNRRVEFVVLD
jgi:OOP family OmpA-OmpF porin